LNIHLTKIQNPIFQSTDHDEDLTLFLEGMEKELNGCSEQSCLSPAQMAPLHSLFGQYCRDLVREDGGSCNETVTDRYQHTLRDLLQRLRLEVGTTFAQEARSWNELFREAEQAFQACC
jgi:hypothetical protein